MSDTTEAAAPLAPRMEVNLPSAAAHQEEAEREKDHRALDHVVHFARLDCARSEQPAEPDEAGQGPQDTASLINNGVLRFRRRTPFGGTTRSSLVVPIKSCLLSAMRSRPAVRRQIRLSGFNHIRAADRERRNRFQHCALHQARCIDKQYLHIIAAIRSNTASAARACPAVSLARS